MNKVGNKKGNSTGHSTLACICVVVVLVCLLAVSGGAIDLPPPPAVPGGGSENTTGGGDDTPLSVPDVPAVNPPNPAAPQNPATSPGSSVSEEDVSALQEEVISLQQSLTKMKNDVTALSGRHEQVSADVDSLKRYQGEVPGIVYVLFGASFVLGLVCLGGLVVLFMRMKEKGSLQPLGSMPSSLPPSAYPNTYQGLSRPGSAPVSGSFQANQNPASHPLSPYEQQQIHAAMRMVADMKAQGLDELAITSKLTESGYPFHIVKEACEEQAREAEAMVHHGP